MKKVFLFLSLILIFMCTACFDPFNMKPIPEGEYVYTRSFNNDKVEGIEYFSSAKVIIKEITEEEYLTQKYSSTTEDNWISLNKVEIKDVSGYKF